MTPRFFVSELNVVDRTTRQSVALAATGELAHMIADALNRPWTRDAPSDDQMRKERDPHVFVDGSGDTWTTGAYRRPDPDATSQRRALPGPVDPTFDVRQRALNMDLGARVARHSDGMLR